MKIRGVETIEDIGVSIRVARLLRDILSEGVNIRTLVV